METWRTDPFMKKCSYCGKENKETDLLCTGCGTELDMTSETKDSSGAAKNSQDELTAKTGTLILIAYLASGSCIPIIAQSVSRTGPQRAGFSSAALSPGGLLFSHIFAGIVMICLAIKLIPNAISNAAPTAAAWITGSWKGIGQGLLIGCLIGACNRCLAVVGRHYVPYKHLNPLDRMAFTPGADRVSWIIATMALAPVFEEMLFRGILYGAYRRSFGAWWAATTTTLLFVGLHFPNYTDYPSNIVIVVAGALAALWFRLHWGAIGPAIAVHLGYNAVAVLGVLF